MGPLTLLTLGPGLLRLAGQALGGRTAEVAEKTATVLDQVKGLPATIAQAKVEQTMAELNPAELVDLKRIAIRADEIRAEVRKAELAAGTAQHAETEATARVEAQSCDPYVRRTRPRLARQSAYVTFAYGIASGVFFPVANAAWGLSLPGPEEWVILALFSPCMAYMGARSFDAFSRKGKT